MLRTGISRRWTDEERAELARLINQGKSINALAARFGRNWQGIRREAAALGLRVERRRRVYSPNDLQRQREEFLLPPAHSHASPRED